MRDTEPAAAGNNRNLGLGSITDNFSATYLLKPWFAWLSMSLTVHDILTKNIKKLEVSALFR